ncbi:MAG: cytochrome C oxidase subunit II [Myxococcales bacterium]|nr:cytochrome C oxidase subunit II [Myxococcales bacterium]
MLEPLFQPFLIDWLVPSASTYADDIDFLWELIFWIVGAWFLATEGIFFWLIIKFAKKRSPKAQYITGELKSQKQYISYPHMAVLVFDILILVFAVKVWYDVKQDLPPAESTVRVIGQQWAWTFQNAGPDGKLDSADDITTMNELHVQLGTVYHYKLEALDVLHNFSVPVFRLKQDAIPGRVITGWFEPTLTGEYDVQCAEICGIGHGLMGARIHIETPEQHAAWMASHAPISLASATPDVSAEE